MTEDEMFDVWFNPEDENLGRINRIDCGRRTNADYPVRSRTGVTQHEAEGFILEQVVPYGREGEYSVQPHREDPHDLLYRAEVLGGWDR